MVGIVLLSVLFVVFVNGLWYLCVLFCIYVWCDYFFV